ncbi:MAG: IS982 family transposase [Chloroflexia bacterium]
MDDIKIIAAFCIIEDTLHHLGHKTHHLAGVTDAEVLFVAVVSAMYFHNHHERTLFVLKALRYITKPLSISRFSRRLHALAHWLEQLVELVGQLFAKGEVFIIDSMPVPMCQYVRAGKCKKMNAITDPMGKAYFGKCVAKKWRFYGWRLHLVCTQDRVPVAFQLLPASWHDLTPIYDLTVGLPEGASVYADKAYISAPVKADLRTEVAELPRIELVTYKRANMKVKNTQEERWWLRKYRGRIETANSQLENMGIQSLHARTNQGLAIKVLSSLLALVCINL